ncbi:MAG: bifunctional demethylmenaquinone methyltransferase/2-methoxy-6-polyprenyl-1,4-benzoquinol methylase UbiE [Tepidisphaeraceae bacterium]
MAHHIMRDPMTAWEDKLLRNPHEVADKRARVRNMFAAIAPSYDINNRLHSLWQDQRWRRKAVKSSDLKPTDVVVDVACGTGDLSLAFARELARLAAPLAGRVLGLDFTFEMLPIAERKCEIRNPRSEIRYINADAQSLPLPDRCADVVSIAFGIRNVQDPQAALREFHRVLRPGGRVIILEFSLPTNHLLRALYNFYFRKILPRTATLISGDKTGAYKYLPESVNTFITREAMVQMMCDAGFVRIVQFSMTFGVCICYRGVKP